MNYNEDYFIGKFSVIKSEHFGVGQLIDDFDPNVKCAMGHCGMELPGIKTEEAIALQELFDRHLQVDVISLNDGCCPKALTEKGLYQNEPKERIMAALYKIKELKRTTKKRSYSLNSMEMSDSIVIRVIIMIFSSLPGPLSERVMLNL